MHDTKVPKARPMTLLCACSTVGWSESTIDSKTSSRVVFWWSVAVVRILRIYILARSCLPSHNAFFGSRVHFSKDCHIDGQLLDLALGFRTLLTELSWACPTSILRFPE